jgi:DNA polymerase II small subunit
MMDAELKKQYVVKLLERNILVEPSRLADCTEDDFKAMLEGVTLPQKAVPGIRTNVRIIYNYSENAKKRDIQSFVTYFNKRFEALQKILRSRFQLSNVTSIIKLRNDKSEVSVIGLISEIQKTKNGHIMLTIEDPTGSVQVLVNKNREDLICIANELVLDEVIGISGTRGDKIIFSNQIILPDIPMNKELKKSPDEVYAAFISDIHVGSTKFLPEKLERFLAWINGELGNDEHKNISAKLRYLFIAGDLVEGVGIYPNQEKELVIHDVCEQYKKCAEYLKRIPSHIHIIICPGNHDAVSLSEPQPFLTTEFSSPLYELPNVVFVTNPGYVNIHSSDKFPGFDVLLYHGYSFTYYADKIESLRQKGGLDRIDLVMRFLLQKRHLAPTHASTLYIPETEYDPFVIQNIPDFFASGHVHKVSVSNFRSTTLVCGSCWQERTTYEEKLGLNPEPARVPVVNLQTREVKILRF